MHRMQKPDVRPTERNLRAAVWSQAWGSLSWIKLSRDADPWQMSEKQAFLFYCDLTYTCNYKSQI